MASSVEIMQLCRLCLVKDEVNIPIFEESRQVAVKISSCLPVKVSKEDNLPKKICDGCSYKLDMFYEFYKTSANSEKRLIQLITPIDANSVPVLDNKEIRSHSVPSENVVLKQEILDFAEAHDGRISPDDLNVSADSDYLGPEAFEYHEEEEEEEEEDEDEEGFNETAASDIPGPSSTIIKEPIKRKRRAAAMRSYVPELDSDDEDEAGLVGRKIAKTEEDSDDNVCEDPEPTAFVGLPDDDEQPGPSGMRKAISSSEPPCGNEILKKFRRPIDDQQQINTPSSHTCSVCNKMFKTISSLSVHQNVHNEKLFECEECDKKFKRIYEVKIHFETYHSKVRNFTCEMCGKVFFKKQLLKYHQARHMLDYKVKCDQCEKGFYTMIDFKRHYAVRHKGVRFVCNDCNKSFLDENCFKRHIKTHDSGYEKVEYKCTECGKLYNTRGGLNVHMKKSHENISYVCDICGKSVSSKTSLNHHIMVHTGEKPFVCDTCGKCFNKKMLLRIHERIHTKVKPYNCSVCEKSFSQRSTLTVHMRYHTGYRPYHCSICQKDFVTKTLLKVHAKTHGISLVNS